MKPLTKLPKKYEKSNPMPLRRHLDRMLNVACYCHNQEKRRKERQTILATFTASQTEAVRIILASGMAELYKGPVRASRLMEKHPGLCLTRPEVFKNPRESIVSPGERLLPGQKFYLVPWTTVRKLQQRVPSAVKGDADKVVGEDSGISEESGRSAKDFYVCRERWSKCSVKRLGNGMEQQRRRQEQQEEKEQQKMLNVKSFTPRMRMTSSMKGKIGGWKPSLATVEEISP